ncbi:MAG: glycosyltransferase [Leptolyngbyaceae cyanobacterium]
MRVLFISCRFPTDLQRDVQGTFRRFNLFLDAFKEIAQLDVLFYVPSDVDCSAIAAHQKALSEHWGTKINLFLCPQRVASSSGSKWQRQFAPIFDFRAQGHFFATSAPRQQEALETCLDRQPDAIFCHRLEAMTPILQTQRSLPPLFFDLDDIEHVSFARQICQPPTRAITKLYYLQIPALWWGERRSIQKSLCTFVCSSLDQQYLTLRWGLQGVVSVPNAVSIPPVPQPVSPEPTLMFLGGYYYFPNLNAANFLIEQVWPHIYQARPDARLIIAGTHPENIQSYSAGVPGVEFTGFVDDLDALYARSRVVCCPILSGGGTRVKIIEAAAYGKPVVTTPIGAEGLSLRDGETGLMRTSARDIAQACLTLLSDESLCQRLGTAAHRQATQNYDRNQIIRLIQTHVRRTLEHTSTVSSHSLVTP